MALRSLFPVLVSALALSACAGPERFMNPDCHSCALQDQAWTDFPFSSLEGSWKGSVETQRNERDAAAKEKKDSPSQLRFLSAAAFLAAKGLRCKSVPGNALVLNGLLWSDGSAKREFETFLPAENDRVAYGRISFDTINGATVCHYRRLGRVMGMNRLRLPTVSFSEEAAGGRTVASAGGVSTDVSLEFLHFAAEARGSEMGADQRRPASAAEQERPPLMIRVFKMSSRSSDRRGQWTGSEEQIYRLWREN